MGSSTAPPPAEYDVIIIGAGLSGINAAYRLQTELPNHSYTILESRKAIGGTWDFFRYPGIRSDSDLHTYSYPWRPWAYRSTIADGASILEYLRECARDFGIDRKIQYEQRLLSADWSSGDASWTLSVENPSKKGSEEEDHNIKIFKARFIIFATGYYDYSTPLEVDIPNLSDFKGQVINPQFWPSDLDYSNKKMIIIGSGATAITLFPVLAETASKVTMLQRSPSYIISLPAEDTSDILLRRLLPTWISSRLLRWKFLIFPALFLALCKNFPRAGRGVLRRGTKALLPPNIPLDPHFDPSYFPWEQRVCATRNGDFYAALRKGNADIVTDTIDSVTPTGIQTSSGQDLKADIIITATGLKVLLAGGTEICVDGKPLNFKEKFIWNSSMLEDVPNAAFCIGYANNTWTLGVDTTALLVCRVLKYMRANGFESATPSISGDRPTSLPGDPSPSTMKFKSGGDWKATRERTFFDLSSTYIDKAKKMFPKAGDRGPWLPRSYYFFDLWRSVWGSATTGLSFVGTERKRL